MHHHFCYLPRKDGERVSVSRPSFTPGFGLRHLVVRRLKAWVDRRRHQREGDKE